MKRILYPISANPPTWGHAELMRRAARAFDEVLWVAAVNPKKQLGFSPESQIAMMQDYVDFYKLQNVKLDHFQGSIMRYAIEHEASFILRGIRNSSDLPQEMSLAAGYRGISTEVEMICMFADPRHSQVSSSLVRELAELGESIAEYVHPRVADKVREAVGVGEL